MSGRAGTPIGVSAPLDLDAVRRGDRAAVSALVSAFLPRVFGLCYRMLRSRDLAEEVTQEAFARALQALPGLRDQERLASWLLTIAANTVREHIRKAKRAGPLEVDPPVEDPPPGADSAARARERALERAVAGLDPDDRELFLLHKLEGLKLKQLAERDAVSLPAMKSRVHRIQARVRVAALAELRREGES